MKTKFIIILLTAYLFAYNLQAQTEKRIIIEKFVQTKAIINGVSHPEVIVGMGGYIALYKKENQEGLYLANVSTKKGSQSYGAIDSYEKRTIKDAKGKDIEVLEFNWHYKNTYDGVSGIAKVQIVKISNADTVTATVKMIAGNLDILIYKGYMESTDTFMVNE